MWHFDSHWDASRHRSRDQEIREVSSRQEPKLWISQALGEESEQEKCPHDCSMFQKPDRCKGEQKHNDRISMSLRVGGRLNGSIAGRILARTDHIPGRREEGRQTNRTVKGEGWEHNVHQMWISVLKLSSPSLDRFHSNWGSDLICKKPITNLCWDPKSKALHLEL